jgi:hypothetical protein
MAEISSKLPKLVGIRKGIHVGTHYQRDTPLGFALIMYAKGLYKLLPERQLHTSKTATPY